MDIEQVRALYNRQLRCELHMGGYVREETADVVRYVSQLGEKGYILWSNLKPQGLTQAIRREAAYFAEMNQAFEWKVYDYDEPACLQDALVQEGFAADDPEAVMVLQLHDGHSLLNPTAIQVQELTDERGIHDIIGLEEDIWQVSFKQLGDRLIRDKLKDPAMLHLYGVYQEGQIVSAAWMYIEPQSSFVSLWGGSTRPGYRGIGCYTALLAARAKQAVQSGRSFLTVDASPMSRPILSKCGFAVIGQSSGYQSPSLV